MPLRAIQKPTSSTAKFKSADDRRKAKEELQRRIDEVKIHTSTFIQDCIDEEDRRKAEEELQRRKAEEELQCRIYEMCKKNA